MNTRNTFEAARFFLKKFQQTTDLEVSQFYLYAFLAAWRSVLDALLYDLADYYGIIDEIGRNPAPLNQRIDNNSYYWVSKRRADHGGDPDAEEARKWWFGKWEELKKLELYDARIQFVHEGVPPKDFYLPPPASGHFSLKNYCIWLRDVAIRDKCQEALSLMENIVVEAENRLKINLT